jgi:tetrathionate reductase subunit B
MKNFRWVIDISKCNGCYVCQIACKDEHVDNEWPPFAKPEPVAGQFWMKVNETERGTIPKVKVSYVPTPCQHCEDAPCMAAATGGAIYRRPDGLVIIDPQKAVGQKQLVAACPYGAIYWNDQLDIPQKCTGCAHLIDGPPLTGQPKAMPRCVDACPTQALVFEEYDDIEDEWNSAEVFHPEYETNPRVRYIQLPKRFITGAIYDPVKDLCLEGANITATDLTTGAMQNIQSDNFGDFWFEQLEADRAYSVKIDMPGYYGKTIGAVSTVKDVNLGDIALYAM